MHSEAPRWWGRCPACGTRRDLTAPCVCGAPGPDGAGVLQLDEAFAPEGFTAARSDHLQVLEGHFWYAGRRDLVLRRLDRVRPDGLGRVVELGCGRGLLLGDLAARADALLAVEGHAEAAAAAARRCPEALVLRGDLTALPLEGGQADVVVALDVLEHVDPDAFLAEARRLVRPGGHLLLTVPAFPALWSEADAVAGHRLRYTTGRLRPELDRQGWSWDAHTHYQAALFPLVWASRRLARGGPARLERQPPAIVSRVLGAVNRAEVALLGGRTLPFGSTLLVQATAA